MNATPNKIYETFSSDYTTPIHHAMRADGQWFTRMQVRDMRFGRKLTAWRKTAVAPDRLRELYSGATARLPKE